MHSAEVPIIVERGFEPFLISAIENANDAVIVLEYDPGPTRFRIRYVNPMFERQTGYGAAETIGRYPEFLYGPKTDRAEIEHARQTILSRLPARFETLRYRKDGSTFWADVNMRPLFDADDVLLGIIAIQRDATERRKTVENLELFSAAINQASDAMAIFEWRKTANEWRLAYVNEAFLQLTGYRHDEVIGRASDFLIGPETDMALLNVWRANLLAGEPVRGEITFYRADRTHFWAELNGRPLQRDGETVNTIIVYRDVTDVHERELRLTYEASHDPLTGAYNRRFFERALDESLEEARAENLSHGVLYLDLDGFKPINDRYGHEAGDQVLAGVAAAVNAKLRRVDLFARIGGDEFAVLLRGCPPARTEVIATEILGAISGMMLVWSGHALRIGASIGVTTIDGSVGSGADALRRADEACYEAKRAGRNRICVGALLP